MLEASPGDLKKKSPHGDMLHRVCHLASCVEVARSRLLRADESPLAKHDRFGPLGKRFLERAFCRDPDGVSILLFGFEGYLRHEGVKFQWTFHDLDGG